MDNNANNSSIDVDVEKLMSHIRQRARSRPFGAMEHYSEDPDQSVPHDADKQPDIDGAFAAQAEFNHLLVQSLGTVARNLKDVQGSVALFERELREKIEDSAQASQELSDQLGLLERSSGSSLEELSDRIDYLAAQRANLEEKVAQKLQQVEQSIQASQATIDQITRSVEASINRISAVEDKVQELETIDQRRREEDKHSLNHSFSYTVFEQHAGHDDSQLRRRQRAYLELFRGKENVLDVGCRRGDFVERLTGDGIHVTGVDMNQEMIDFCRNRGLNVVQADPFDYLDGLADGSLDGIFAAQFVEHLSPNQIVRFIHLSAKRLKPGGIIVVEAMNVNCPGVLADFYLDPGHIRPVPLALLRLMFEQAPFKLLSMKFSSPIPESHVPELFDVASGLPPQTNQYRDYAVIAIRS